MKYNKTSEPVLSFKEYKILFEWIDTLELPELNKSICRAELKHAYVNQSEDWLKTGLRGIDILLQNPELNGF